jgi:hypothetical protein
MPKNKAAARMDAELEGDEHAKSLIGEEARRVKGHEADIDVVTSSVMSW